MTDDTKPLSDLVAQGWEVAGFSTAHDGGQLVHTVLLRRQRQHKVLVLHKRLLRGGIATTELDV